MHFSSIRWCFIFKIMDLSLIEFMMSGFIDITATAKLIRAFVFATRIVQFLYFLNPKFSACSHLLCLYNSSVCVGPVRKLLCWFSHETAQIYEHHSKTRK